MSWLMFQMGGLGPMQGQVSTSAVVACEALLVWLRTRCISVKDAGRTHSCSLLVITVILYCILFEILALWSP